jgi:hypothetical protein
LRWQASQKAEEFHMSIPSLILLLLLPSTEWLLWSAFLPSIRKAVAQQGVGSPPLLKELLTRVFLFSGRTNLLVYLVVLFGTATWLWFNNFTWQQVGVASAFKLDNLALGTTCGIALFGALILLAAFQKKLIPQRQFLWEVPAVYALGYTRWILLPFGAAALELWRAASISSLMNDSVSPGAAILLCSGVYALRLFPRGPYRVAYGTFEGLAFGGLYVWVGSLVAPLVARLACELGMLVVFRGTVPAPPDFSLPPVANCPLCGKGFTRGEVRFRQSFTCPQCRQVVGLPNWRMPLVRFLCFAGLVGFLGVFLEFSPKGTPDNFVNFCVAYIGAFLATIGTIVLMDVLSFRRLSPGSPGMPSLGLTSSTREPGDQDRKPPA